MTRTVADLLLLVAALVWGIAFLFQKSALEHVGALTFVAGRAFIATLVLAPMAWHMAKTERGRMSAVDTKALAWVGVTGGVLFFLGAIFQQVGLYTATVSNTGFLTALYIVFTPLLAWGFLKRTLPPIVWPAALIALLGTFCLGGGSLSGFVWGDMLVAISAVFWAAHLLATANAARYANAAFFTTIQFATVGAIALVGALATETITFAGLASAWKEFLFVGVLSSALTFTILTVAMKHTSASEAAIIVSLEMVVAAVAAYLVLGERIGAIGIFGAGLMFFATLMIQVPGPFERFLFRAQPSPRPPRAD
jgi:drug/metabolite transporter (DMT)-like permease